jgi:hypothetical protein
VLPAGWEDTVRAASLRLGDGAGDWSAIRDGAIRGAADPAAQCAPTALTAYANDLLKGAKNPILPLFLQIIGAFDFAQYDALFFGTESAANRFGVNGEYTSELNAEIGRLKNFWDVSPNALQLMPMHGADVFSDPERLARVLDKLVGSNPVANPDHATNVRIAQLIINLIASDPVYQSGANPIFTLNAFNYTDKGDPQPAGVSDRIVMGDGILQGMAAVGLQDMAPRAILAHEYSHHVQSQDDLFDSPLTGADATRRTELMADAFGSYFLVNVHGGHVMKDQVLAAEQTFFQVGDCQLTAEGHHGTPDQRIAASTWGATTGEDQRAQGHIMPSLALDTLYEAELPTILGPNAG